MREEIGAEIFNLRYLGTLENIFNYNGALGHEIVQVYDGQFVDESLYSSSSVSGVEGSGPSFCAVWKPLSAFLTERPLYPHELLGLLSSRASVAV